LAKAIEATDLGVQRLDHPAGSRVAPSLRPVAADFEPLVHTSATEIFGELSPDAHWLTYQSDESGQNEV
jgi:hypothetical protein